jgi:uncharacterized protein (TIGR03083 family)
VEFIPTTEEDEVSVNHEERCEALSAELERFASALDGAYMATPVATCPPWNLAELVKHTGEIHRWSARMVAEGMTRRLSFRELDLRFPDEPAQIVHWFRAGGEALLDALRKAGPDQPTWAWGADQHARFWSRRQLHETAVHRADAELALGREPLVDAAVAVDGVDEFLDNLPYATFSPVIKDLKGDGETLHVHCTDADGEWLIRLDPKGFTWEHGHAKGDVAVRGAASDLLLLLYGRRKPEDERFQIFGDGALLDRWLAGSSI